MSRAKLPKETHSRLKTMARYSDDMLRAYLLAQRPAQKKEAFDLRFDSPEAAQAHHRNRTLAGAAGSVLGGALGGGLGGRAAGVPGAVVGAGLGALLGRAPGARAADVAYDMPSRTRHTYSDAMQRMNTAGGLHGVRIAAALPTATEFAELAAQGQTVIAEKCASEESSNGQTLGARVGDAALGSVALPLAALNAKDAVEPLLGVQPFLHGTSTAAGESILREGLKRHFGGIRGGGAASEGNPSFVEHSKGRIHVAPATAAGRNLAGSYAKLVGAAQHPQWQGNLPPSLAAAAELDPSLGTVLSGTMPYRKFHSLFERDPDFAFATAYRTNKTDIPADTLRKGMPSLRDLWRGRDPHLLRYYKEHPERLQDGLRSLGIAAALTAGGGVLLHDAFADKTLAQKTKDWISERKGGKIANAAALPTATEFTEFVQQDASLDDDAPIAQGFEKDMLERLRPVGLGAPSSPDSSGSGSENVPLTHGTYSGV